MMWLVLLSGLFRRTPEVMYVPQQFSTDNRFCKQD